MITAQLAVVAAPSASAAEPADRGPDRREAPAEHPPRRGADEGADRRAPRPAAARPAATGVAASAGPASLPQDLLELAGPLLSGEPLSLLGGIASLAARNLTAPAVIPAIVVPTPARVELAGATGSAAQYVLPEAEAGLAALLAQALGRDYGTTVDQNDLRWMANTLGMRDAGSMINAKDVRDLVARHRNQLNGPLRWLGRDPGGHVTEDEMRAAAAIVGADLGAVPDPLDVGRLRSAIARHVESQPLTAFATIRGVELVTPSHYTKLVGFHEAAYGIALPLTPTRRPGMATLPTRGRVTGRQSAVDIAVAPGTRVFAPVTGTVASVEHYALYGRYPDTKIRIVPDANPGLLVTVLHVTGPEVRPGSRITAGSTPLAARATQFPFESQIDRFAGWGPHVHVEVRAN